MQPTEIAAYIGAAAWLPQIITWVYSSLSKPYVTIVPDKFVEVGFTTFGPIFNLRMMLFTDKKHLIVDGLEFIIRHEDGDSHTIRWSGLLETFSEITDDTGNRQVVSKDQTPIAIKIGPDTTTEKFIRFQEQRFHDADRPRTLELVAHFNFLKSTSDKDFVKKTLESKEFSSVIENRENSFWWKPGRYEVEAKLSAIGKFHSPTQKYFFILSDVDVKRLRLNIKTISEDLTNTVNSNLPDFMPTPIDWYWANVEINKGP